MVLEYYDIPLADRIFCHTVLNITYYLGRYGCSDPSFTNTLTISFSDVSKGEENFEFIFINCRESEKIKKAILRIPVPKN